MCYGMAEGDTDTRIPGRMVSTEEVQRIELTVVLIILKSALFHPITAFGQIPPTAFCA
jgi:hypothetical protein